MSFGNGAKADREASSSESKNVPSQWDHRRCAVVAHFDRSLDSRTAGGSVPGDQQHEIRVPDAQINRRPTLRDALHQLLAVIDAALLLAGTATRRIVRVAVPMTSSGCLLVMS